MQKIIHTFIQIISLGVKVRRLDDEGVSVPVYPTKVSLKAEYDPKVSNVAYIYIIYINIDYNTCPQLNSISNANVLSGK